MDPTIVQAVKRVAKAQHGVISRAQALECQLSPKQIAHAVRSGRWKRIHPGVYLTHSGSANWNARAWAALLRAGTGAVLSLGAAAYLWGLEPKAPSMLHVAIPEERTIVRPTGTRVTRRRAIEVVKRKNFPVTSVRQTVLDLTAEPGFTLDETAALLGRAAQRQLLLPDQLLDALDAYWNHPLADVLRRACADAADGVESSLESRILRTVIRAHGLPGFALQVPHDDEGVAATHGAAPNSGAHTTDVGVISRNITGSRPRVERSDLRNAAHGIRIEGDGLEWHRDTFHEDRRRDLKAAAAGDLTLRITWAAAEQPCEVALDLALTMTHRGWTGVPTACGPSCDVVDRWAAETGRAAS
ncbi:type IV toxin-antitoxin system AbiEi family antitoxin domain-containing protein [Ornithinimicrobium sp. F0845]|uniref:type IV toxin-antitoxin system AbiEi family antitoxin domain-containing protein n=1 Tax=Ornithinimicrobium sp. F0845 TaxID=2926412 RepID=UPI001FF65ADA|nr:type IV toxin-antitoxin system AbiEi family antitoxin domain-containing protein [Ornithinimicrobium sp. F0845]MCK0113381.1 type IV toxin-antitoxin system AbiEi family antitoxin domain-containing protein [Ornithinimicrobium sp. F0845]